MNGKPSDSPSDEMDQGWDSEAPPSRRRQSDPKPRSPIRAGTNPWDDRTLPLLGRGETSAGRAAVRAPSPVRSGTASLQDLLPAAMKRRYEPPRAENTKVVRSGTWSADELMAAMRAGGADRARDVQCEPSAPPADVDPFGDLDASLLDLPNDE
jgi:hypothetical protein